MGLQEWNGLYPSWSTYHSFFGPSCCACWGRVLRNTVQKCVELLSTFAARGTRLRCGQVKRRTKRGCCTLGEGPLHMVLGAGAARETSGTAHTDSHLNKRSRDLYPNHKGFYCGYRSHLRVRHAKQARLQLKPGRRMNKRTGPSLCLPSFALSPTPDMYTKSAWASRRRPSSATKPMQTLQPRATL